MRQTFPSATVGCPAPPVQVITVVEQFPLKYWPMGVGGVIFVSDKQARLKPCLRCGYSLRYTAGVKNCPECGLAVRVSLSDNTAPEWSSPRWQRWRAIAFAVLAAGTICQLLSM